MPSFGKKSNLLSKVFVNDRGFTRIIVIHMNYTTIILCTVLYRPILLLYINKDSICWVKIQTTYTKEITTLKRFTPDKKVHSFLRNSSIFHLWIAPSLNSLITPIPSQGWCRHFNPWGGYTFNSSFNKYYWPIILTNLSKRVLEQIAFSV